MINLSLQKKTKTKTVLCLANMGDTVQAGSASEVMRSTSILNAVSDLHGPALIARGSSLAGEDGLNLWPFRLPAQCLLSKARV